MSITMAESTRLEELQRRVQRDPASISFAALAEEYRRLGLFQDAIDTCRAGLLRHPSYPSARVTLGRALLEIGEYDDASIELEQVLRVAPENLAAIRALAEIHRRRGEMPESIEFEVEPVQEPVPEVTRSAVAAQIAPSPMASVAVQSSTVQTYVEPRSVAGLEQFLAAIQRARRDLRYQAAR